MKEKKWEILHKSQISSSKSQIAITDIINIVLENRGMKTEKDIDDFLHADLSSVTPKTVGVDSKQLTKAIKRIQKAIEQKEQIVVFGDYDVDGITGTAILWETLYALGATVVPYIPNRIGEGYGLSIAGINNIQSQITNIKLIITVDNGIVANEAVDFANEQGIDVIATDHHTIGQELPKAHAIVHTTKLCGAGVAWLLSQEITNYKSQITNNINVIPAKEGIQENGTGSRIKSGMTSVPTDHLALVALATVADLVPLTGANRVLLKFGLAELHNTRRPGLLALFQEAKIEPDSIGVYEIGHMIGPRLNAMGRLESAMDSLRLLCTKDRLRAKVLADTLQRINKERQLLTQSAAMHAIEQFRVGNGGFKKKLLFIAHDQYEEGIIGLVAGKLVEEYYLPAIVLSKGETMSKASARSIAGFNIIEFIRTSSHLLVNAGGHPMAAGFTVETAKIELLQEALEKLAEKMVDGETLQRILRIDCELPLEMVNQEFFMKLQTLGPFGMANPEPTFVSSVVVKDIKTVGKERSHLKLKVAPSLRSDQTTKQSQKRPHPNLPLKGEGDQGYVISMDAIAFNQGDKASTLKVGDKIQIVYTIAENEWNGKISLQLKVKDINIR